MSTAETLKFHNHANHNHSSDKNGVNTLSEVTDNGYNTYFLLDKQNEHDNSSRYTKTTERSKHSSLELEEEIDKTFFKTGNIVLGHVTGFPWWPAKLVEVHDNKCSVLFYGPDRKNKALFAKINPFFL